jgi:hypothetical protein
MSVTITQNELYYETAALLRHYDVHHTEDRPHDPSLNEHASPIDSAVQNPPDWPSRFRRVPPIRPVNTQLDFSQRGTRNTPETVFVFIMLQGVRTVSVGHPSL